MTYLVLSGTLNVNSVKQLITKSFWICLLLLTLIDDAELLLFSVMQARL